MLTNTMMTMMMTFFNYLFNTRGDICGGASVRGEKHIKLKKPNQDAFRIKFSKYGTTLVAADGVGSFEKSHYASKAITKATVKSFLLFEKGCIGRKDITKTINKLYGKYVRKKYHSSTASTCMFVTLSNKYGVFAGQVGDGLCYLNINGEGYILKKKTDEFLNTADAIFPSDEHVNWTTKHFDLTNDDSIKIMIATDGVSETIISGMEADCLEYYLKDISEKNAFLSGKTLKEHLINWNVKASTDDKTMIIFSRG